MTKQLEVVYEDGVLRPLQPLPFAEKQHLVVTVTDELSEPPACNAREREQEWIRINALKYPGKWVAVEESQLVGLVSGVNYFFSLTTSISPGQEI